LQTGTVPLFLPQTPNILKKRHFRHNQPPAPMRPTAPYLFGIQFFVVDEERFFGKGKMGYVKLQTLKSNQRRGDLSLLQRGRMSRRNRGKLKAMHDTRRLGAFVA
jgi:hypothetical protein